MKSNDGSKIFTGFRALGYVCDHLPFTVRRHNVHKENYVVTSIGRAFHVYKVSKLAIVSVSDLHEDDITAIASDDYLVYTASRKIIRAFKRGRYVIKTFDGHDAEVHLLLPFGPHLISVDENSKVIVWDIEAEQPYLEISFPNAAFQVSSILHPSTYLNKVLFGSHQGTMQLWNVKSNRLVYSFEGWSCAVTVLCQAPAIDVVAVGLADGRIIVHNLRQDETLMSFTHEGGPVTSITFRTDGLPIMLSASITGSVAVWDLEGKRLLGQLDKAHSAAISSVHCLQGEPLMLSSASDNSLKVWIFDLPDGTGRVLRERSCHSAPPSRIQFYGRNSDNILSAGQDAVLRCFSTVHEKYSKSLGRASYNKKMSRKLGLKKDPYVMPPVKEFAAIPTRESDWDSIVCLHSGLGLATSWNFVKSTMGAHKLLHQRFEDKCLYPRVQATAVMMSACGNFVILGYSSGHVDAYNLQSGIHRGTFGEPTAHAGTVRGIAIDALNQTVVTSGADAQLKYWAFKSKTLLQTVHLSSAPCQLRLRSSSSLLAVACDDFSVIIYDFDTRKLVRKMSNSTFKSCGAKIMDLVFSPDGRWLVIADMDCTLTTWDIASGMAVDCVVMESAVTSMSFSPGGDFLATTHVDDLGVYLWSNLTLFSHVNLSPLPHGFNPLPVVLPTTSRRKQSDADDDIGEEEEPVPMTDETYKSPRQISDELVTLSLLPNSRWQHLLQLDVIKQRNKPKEPLRVPRRAPFFLPTIPNLEGTVKFSEELVSDSDERKGEKKVFFVNPLSPFAKQLLSGSETDEHSKTMTILKEMGPSAIDMEVGLLGPDAGGSLDLCAAFLNFSLNILMSRRDFELINAYLGVFLAKNGETLIKESRLVELVQEIREKDKSVWNDVQHQLHQCLCVAKFLRSATL